MAALTGTLPDDRNLALSKLKKIADNNFNVAELIKLVFEGLENIQEKGENAGYQHFLLFPLGFQKPLLLQ